MAPVPDRRVVIFSDIEMGAGGAIDDFLGTPWLAARLRRYGDDELPLDLVFNGDTFDLLKTSYRGVWPHHVTADIATGKMARVADAHPEFFTAVADLLARRSDLRVHFVAGNHDLELFFPEVQSMLRTLLGVLPGDERVLFHGHGFDLGRMHVEHGSQLDPLFAVDPVAPFLQLGDAKVLNLAWAAVALLDVVIPLQPVLGHHDRLKPKKLVLDLIPEVRELLTSVGWTYWTRDYWRDFFNKNDPMKRVSWTMIKEVVWRMAFDDVDVQMRDDFQRRLLTSDAYDLYVVGHQHEPGWWSYGRRKMLRTGALRDEFMLDAKGHVQRPINKTWAEVFMAGDEVVRSHLVEESAPPRPPGTMPDSIFDVVPAVRALLAPQATREGEHVQQQAQEDRERAADRDLG